MVTIYGTNIVTHKNSISLVAVFLVLRFINYRKTRYFLIITTVIKKSLKLTIHISV